VAVRARDHRDRRRRRRLPREQPDRSDRRAPCCRGTRSRTAPPALDDGDNDLWAQTSCPPGRNLRYKADNSGWEVRPGADRDRQRRGELPRGERRHALHPATTIGGINLADRIIPPGMIAMFASACPTGWSEYTALRGRFPRGEAAGSATSLDAGGTDDAVVVAHGHSVSGTAADAGAHSHTYSATTGGPIAVAQPRDQPDLFGDEWRALPRLLGDHGRPERRPHPRRVREHGERRRRPHPRVQREHEQRRR
jgi:hypothetical protein